MANRKQASRAQDTVECSAQSQAPKVHLTPPTDEEERYFQSIERLGDEYDRQVILGGPRTPRQ
jgi:hypothetical protein